MNVGLEGKEGTLEREGGEMVFLAGQKIMLAQALSLHCSALQWWGSKNAPIHMGHSNFYNLLTLHFLQDLDHH